MDSTPADKSAATHVNSKPAARQKAVGVAASGRRKIDWDAVERDYRTAKFTRREMAEKYGVSHQAICKRAAAKGWTQDLADQIRQATNATLVAKLVNQEVASNAKEVANTVLAAAEINTRVILGHRTGLQRLTAIKSKLLNQIEQAAELMPELSDVIEMVRKPDDNGVDKANDALRKAMGRSSLVDDLKKLAEVDERVRKGEREAFSIDAATPQDDASTMRQMTDAERAVRLMHYLKGAA